MATTQARADALLDSRPRQGMWHESDYLWLTDRGARRVEFVAGWLEELPTPTDTHQTVLARLFRLFDAHVGGLLGGVVRFAALRLRIGEGRFREPDLLVLQDARDARRAERYWSGADLVVEVVSPDDPDRDYVAKRADYAAAGIPEYWIVDPPVGRITVLALQGDSYIEHGVFDSSARATSALLPEFSVAVAAILDA